jgi:ubiquitin C-terminal hydrolase
MVIFLYKDKEHIYDLFSVINHYGSIASGHYTAFAKNYLSEKWYEFNDATLTEINEE